MVGQALSSNLGAGLGVLLIIYLAVAVLFIAAWVKIISKAGYSGWWVLIGLVPLVNIVMFLVFAFSEWPVTREVQRLRSGYGGGGGYAGGFSLPGARVPPPPNR